MAGAWSSAVRALAVTTLCALTFHGCFAAGASYYGISDLEALARDTHKFEKHYLDRLVGPGRRRRLATANARLFTMQSACVRQ